MPRPARAPAPDVDYPLLPLREYALLADGERGALLGPRGDVVWMCAPLWHSDAVLSSLVGGAGAYAVTPTARFVWGGYYEEGSLIWRSRWVTDAGPVESRDALAFPGDPHTAVLMRQLCAQTRSQVRVVLDLRAGFGHTPMRRLVCERGVWTARAGDLYLRWSGAATAVAARHSGGPRLELRLDLEPGVAHDLVLEVSDRPLNQDPPDSQVLWRGTEHAWSQQVPRLDASLVAADARQAYAVLRGLTGSLGGMVAAATTSLPERSESGRNYDYRYAWIRDQSYAGQAVALAGPHPLLDDAVRFVAGRLLCDGPDTKPAYTCTGERVPDERRLGLAGYPGGGDRIGNWANSQFQLDQFGEALLLFAAAARHDRLDADGWHAAEVAAAAIEKRWQEPDAGIWELDNRLWTHSRLVCVAGLKQMGDAIAAADPATAARWASHAETIMAATSASSVHPTGRWQRAPDDPALDAALLMGSIRGGVPADDPRTRATLRAFTEELTEDLFAYRFRHQPGPLGDGEGAFLLCGFMVALAQLDQGERGLALRWFERNRSGCSTSGLFSEEYDVAQRQLRGNLPQAFVHALFLECSIRLAQT